MNDDSCLNYNNALHNLENNSTSSDPRSLYHNKNDQNIFHYKFLNENKKNNDLDNNSAFQSFSKEILRLKDKIEILTKEKNGLKQQCKAAITQWDKTLRENNEVKGQLIHIQQEKDDLNKKYNYEITQRLKSAKDQARLTEERNSAVHEYNLIMSERDSVHKEMEKLNEELMQYQKKIKTLDQEKKTLLDDLEILKRELNNFKSIEKEFALRQRYKDRIIDYQYGSGFKFQNSNAANKWGSSSSGFSSGWTQYGNFRNPISLSSTNSNMNSIIDIKHKQFSASSSKAELDIELELKKQIQQLEYDYNSIQLEYQKSKMQNEKVVQERESIKILCDKLRRERDRAIRDNAEVLQDLNDFKLKIESNSQIKKYMENQNDLNNYSESKNRHFNNTSSKDSAISADIQDNDFENLQISLTNNFRHRNSFKNIWGFSVRTKDKNVLISGINLDSPAEEKLKLNDVILSINSININENEQLCNELLGKFDKDLQLVVQRKKQLSSILNINLDCCKNNHGIVLENAFLIKKLVPDSAADKNENISVGDRLLSINGKSLENSTIHEVMQLLLHEDNLLLKVYKQSLNNQNLSKTIILNQNKDDQNELNFNKLIINTGKPSYQKDDLHLTTSNKQSNYSPNVGHYQSIKRSSKKSKIYLLNDSSGSFQIENDKQSTLLDKAYNKLFKKSIKSKSDKKEDKSKKTSPEKETLDSFDKILHNLSEKDSKKELESSPGKSNNKNGGTWPSCKANTNLLESPTYGKINPLSSTTYSKKKERKSLAIFTNDAKSDNNSCHQTSSQDNKDLYDDLKYRQQQQSNKMSVRSNNAPLDNDSYKSLLHHHHLKQNERSSLSSSISSYSSTPRENYKLNNNKKYTVNQDSNYKSYNEPTNLSINEFKMKKSIDKKINQNYFKQTSNKQHHENKTMFDQNSQSFNFNLDHQENEKIGFYTVTANKLQLVTSNNYYGQDLESFDYYNNSEQGLASCDNSCADVNSSSNHPYFNSNIENLASQDKKSSPINISQLKARVSINSSSPSYHFNDHQFLNSPSSNYAQLLASSTSNQQPKENYYSSNQNSFKYHNNSNYGYINQLSPLHQPTNALESISNLASSNQDDYLGSINKNQRFNISSNNSIASKLSNCSMDSSSLLHSNAMINNSSNYFKKVSTNESLDSLPYSNIQNLRTQVDWLAKTKQSLDKKSMNSNKSMNKKQINLSADRTNNSDYDKKLLDNRLNLIINSKLKEEDSIASDVNSVRNPGEIRTFVIEKSKEKSLGIQIERGRSTSKNPGIFVSRVNEDSLAKKWGLKVGDQLLEICGINTRSANYEAAATVLRQCGKTVSLKVQYNPCKFYGPNQTTSDQQMGNNPESDCDSIKERDIINNMKRETNLDHREVEDVGQKDDEVDEEELEKHEDTLKNTLKDFQIDSLKNSLISKDSLDKYDNYSDKCLYF